MCLVQIWHLAEVNEELTVTITVVECAVLDGNILHIFIIAVDEYLTCYTDAVECTAVNLYVVEMTCTVFFDQCG